LDGQERFAMAVDQPLTDPLISRLREREHEAIGTLIDRHYAAVHRYLARLLGDREVAAELTQDTFLRAYQALPRLAADSHLEGWLFRIATNLARQHRRRRRVVCWTRLEAAGPLSTGRAGGAGWGSAEPTRDRLAGGGSLEDAVVQQDLVRRALARLSLDQRACLLLYAWTGLTCGEIGAMVGKSPEAVRMTLSRARRRFRAAYGAAAGAGEGAGGTEETQGDAV
jgi:RNA polymerase sigma-70 factor (ECF subfamily)